MSAKAGETTSDPKRQLLRHCVATLAYRAAKALRDAPDSFAALRVTSATRTVSDRSSAMPVSTFAPPPLPVSSVPSVQR